MLGKLLPIMKAEARIHMRCSCLVFPPMIQADKEGVFQLA